MQRFVNNWSTTLFAAVAVGDSTITVPNAQASRISDAAPDAYYLATIEAQGAREIVKITAANGTSGDLTVERAQEGTTAAAWDAGSAIEARLTAGSLNALRFDLTTILTDGDSILIGAEGEILTQH